MQKLLATMLCLLAVQKTCSQAALSGLTCVAQGTQYQYLVSGADSTVPVQVCVTGGVIFGTGGNCITGNGLSQAQVLWNNDTTTAGTVTLTAGGATQTLNITLIAPLAAGSLDTAALTQFIDSAATPASIACSASAGGACSPSYAYQWQQSPDNLNWSDYTGATGQNLAFTGALAQSTYFRRKTTEATTSTYAYTGSAVVFLVQAQGTSLNRRRGFNKTGTAALTKGLGQTRHS